MAGTFIGNLNQAMSGGVNSVAGVQGTITLKLGGTYAVGDEITLVLTNALSGTQTTLGAGDVTNKRPTLVFTYNQKVYALIGDTVYMCAIGQPTVWNDPNASGNSNVQMSDFNGTSMQLVSMGHYQGRLVFGSRDTILSYNVSADPANWSLAQTFQNIGFRSKLSPQALGDLDLIFLYDTGFRSLRVRDSSLNAFVSDIGSPIDLIVQPIIQANSADADSSCAVVDPSTGNYWCFLKDTIYVLSYFPNNKIVAWSTYLPTYDAGPGADENIVIVISPLSSHTIKITIDPLAAGTGSWILEYSDDGTTFTDDVDFSHQGDQESAIGSGLWNLTANPSKRYWRVRHEIGAEVVGYSNIWDSTNGVSIANLGQTSFTPTVFDVYKGQVYCRTSDGAIVLYDTSGYDNCVATVETPFLDNKAPATRKSAKSMDIVYNGQWTLYGCMDMVNKNFTKVQDPIATQSIDNGSYPFNDEGTHFKFKATCSVAAKATLASLILHYEDAGEKA